MKFTYLELSRIARALRFQASHRERELENLLPEQHAKEVAKSMGGIKTLRDLADKVIRLRNEQFEKPARSLTTVAPDALPPCDCGTGDASLPELHADDCAVNRRG